MPTVVALLVAGIAGWFTSDALRPLVSSRVNSILSLLVWVSTYLGLRAVLRHFRDHARGG